VQSGDSLRLCGFISRASALAKSFAKDHFMMLENVFRGSGDIGAILATCGAEPDGFEFKSHLRA
jgi:hypothetical protein